MNESMLRDIEDQPAALAAAVDDLRRQAEALPPLRTVDKVVLTGSGDSLIAALAVLDLYRAGAPAETRSLPGLDAARYEALDGSTLVVVVSVSGEVSRSVETAMRARGSGAATVAITSFAESTLAGVGGCALVMPAPVSRALPHARDYSLTLAALAVLLEHLAGRRLEPLDRWVESSGSILEEAFAALRGTGPAEGTTWFLGAGPGRASAMYGAMKYWEAGGLPAWWDDLEEFAHGSQLMARPGGRAVLIASRPSIGRAAEMIPGLTRMGLESLVVTDAEADWGAPALVLPEVGEDAWFSFTSCLPLQVLAYLEATRKQIDVTVPLGGEAHGETYVDVHVEWAKRSRIDLGDQRSRR
jgi:fructoselysine-6-P-deglycase FrlB-like protein